MLDGPLHSDLSDIEINVAPAGANSSPRRAHTGGKRQHDNRVQSGITLRFLA